MNEIKNINELILSLDNCDKSENCYLLIMKQVCISLVKWEQHFVFEEDRPGRVCLSRTEEYEIFLSCWEKGQEGPIHDIDSEEAWIHPICGQFKEERYKISNGKLDQVSSVLLNDQSYSYMQKSTTIYKYINVYESRSVCLHLYSKPVEKWREYDLETGEISIVDHKYDKIEK